MKNTSDIVLTTTSLGKVKDHRFDMAILPWGATEPHNLHLPYLTDCILSHDVAVEAAQIALNRHQVRAMVMYPINMGAQNPGQWEQPFCIHARYETQKAILTDIVHSLHRQGLRKLLIVNGHGGNNFRNMIRDLALDYPDFLIAVADWFTIIPQKEYFQNPDDHAGELETSVMMHYHPEWVNLSEAGSGESKSFALRSFRNKVAWTPRDWSKVSIDTGIGDPRKASAEKGKQYSRAVVHALVTLIFEMGSGELY